MLAGEVMRQDVPLIVKAIGAVRPPATVTIKPQVGGQIAEVHFKQGQEVEKGDQVPPVIWIGGFSSKSP